MVVTFITQRSVANRFHEMEGFVSVKHFIPNSDIIIITKSKKRDDTFENMYGKKYK